MTDFTERPSSPRCTVYYDGDCPFCVRTKTRFEGILGRRGVEFRTAAEGARECRPPFPVDEFQLEMKVRTAGGAWHGGADGILYLIKTYFPWLAPVAWLGETALLRPVVQACYRGFARRRKCGSGF